MDNNTDTGDTNLILPPIEPREEFIKTAINFLQNQNVRRSPLTQKQKFLRAKGLTEDEIQLACDRAGVFTNDPNSTTINIGHHPQNFVVQPTKQTTLGRIREVLSTVALLSGITYAIYLFYKRFIEPILFGRKKKRKSTEETLEEIGAKIDKNIQDVNYELTRVREEIGNNFQIEKLSREMRDFQCDLEAIKGLLLNRKQFSNPLPLVPPSIPAWQLTASKSQTCEAETETDKHDETGSGSGSSETEVVTKNSDSSLEIISNFN